MYKIMVRITRIKAQKNQRRVNVYLDGKFAFGLDADNLLKAGLKVDQELTEKEIENLVFKNEFQKLVDRTLRLISARPRSEKEIADYLRKRKVGPRLIEAVIKKLKSLGQLDDLEFARWWVEQRVAFRPRGRMGLTMELKRKGINLEIIEATVGGIDELFLAQKVASKRLRAYKKLGPMAFRQKMTAFLSRRGFSWEAIKETVEKFSEKR